MHTRTHTNRNFMKMMYRLFVMCPDSFLTYSPPFYSFIKKCWL